MIPRKANVEYSVSHVPGRFLVRTNDGATNFRIASVPEHDLSPAAWRDWQAGSDSVFIEGINAFRRHVVVAERAAGLRRLRVVRLADNATHFITLSRSGVRRLSHRQHRLRGRHAPLQLLLLRRAADDLSSTISRSARGRC